MFVASRTIAALLLLLLVGGCDEAAERTSTKSAEVKSRGKMKHAFLECWKGLAADEATGSFKGAVAIYHRANGHTAVLFAKECPPANALALDAGGWVLGKAIVDASDGQRWADQGYLIDRKFVERELGTTSEFPDNMFAIVGRLQGPVEQDGIISVAKIEVTQKQRIPNEVYGQFLAYTGDQKNVIDFYLDHEFFDERGYKIIE